MGDLPPPILIVRNLEVAYGGNIKVIWGITLEMVEGEILSLIGSNGAGKTTLIKTIAGWMNPQAGGIFYKNQEITGRDPDKIVNLGIIHIPEGRQLFPQMTVYENLILGAFPKIFRPYQQENLAWVLDLFPRLQDRLRQKAGSMSGGEQQMVAIGRALMARPRLLLVDEMSLGLAPVLVKELFNILTKINERGVSILLVEQNVKHALEVADRAVVLENGRIILSGSARTVLQDTHVRRAYLGL